MYNINEIKKQLTKTAEDAGPVDMVDDEGVVEETDELGGNDMEMDAGGDMGGGMGDDMGMGGGEGMGEPSAPQLDYENIFIERTNDLENFLEDNEDFDIDYSRLT